MSGYVHEAKIISCSIRFLGRCIVLAAYSRAYVPPGTFGEFIAPVDEKEKEERSE